MLGPMPTEHVVSMLRASPPGRAVAVMLTMPRDRIDRLLAVMDGPFIARLLIAATPPRRAALLSYLDDSRLGAELALMPLVEAAALIGALPDERVRPHLNGMHPDRLVALLDAVPDARRKRLAELLDGPNLAGLQRVEFERGVIEGLRRTGASLQWVPDDPGTNLLVGAFRKRIGVALHHVDDEVVPASAVQSARWVFGGLEVDALLVVTNAAPVEIRAGAVPTLVVGWNPGDNDGVLGRALVRLAG